MKKLILLLIAAMISLPLFAAERPSDGVDTVLYLVSMEIQMPVGEIDSGKLVFKRKPVEFRGYMQIVTSYLCKGGQGALTRAEMIKNPKLIKATLFWMSQESFRLFEKQAIETNEYNRRMGGKSTRQMSYCQTAVVTPTFSAIGENDKEGGVTFQFPITRMELRTRGVGDGYLSLTRGHFGYGMDTVTVTVSGTAKAENGELKTAEGAVVVVSNNILADAVDSFVFFKDLQQQNHVNNIMRPNGHGTFTMTKVPWFKEFQDDLEDYFYQKYSYPGVEITDRVVYGK
ncbi:MAG: hypothetical protein J6Y62_01925 [Clostridia bacterium]|nr:hypothetical protein [Clostridia bacterium]